MIGKAKIKDIRSLEQKKHRKATRSFVAEGPKVVGDLLQAMPARLIVGTHEWIEGNRPHLQLPETIEVTEEELRKVSFLQHPQEVLAVFQLPETEGIPTLETGQLALALDGVQDPGNLGTIIRIADWFGINTIYCSPDTADAYNPKVVQATMGSIARVRVVYTPLPDFLGSLPQGTPIYGTLLDGDNLYGQTLAPHGIIVMGNEGKGISEPVRKHITHKLLIPSHPQGSPTVESLNVAIATAIVCAEFRRLTTQHP